MAMAACLLAGCTPDHTGNGSPLGGQSSRPPFAGRFATATLDDSQLRAVRGGFDVGSGTVLQFAVQQATYVNHALVQSTSMPALTFTGSGRITLAGGAVSGAGLASLVLNTANGQLVQQVNRVDIMVSGLRGLPLPGLSSPVLDTLRSAQAIPR